MHKLKYCQKLVDMSLGDLHKKRRDCLARFVASNLDIDVTLSVTSIGKRLISPTSVKHKIKAADYFAGNSGLHKEQLKIYKGLAEYYWGQHKELIVLVDWSGACGEDCFALTASVVGSGRSSPLYTEVHSGKEQETQAVHNQFLENLHEVIPKHLAVVIITDAGFHRDWFMKVSSFGWDFIGRIYSKYHYLVEGEETWEKASNIQFSSVGKAHKIGRVQLGKTKQPASGFLYSYREKLSGKPHKSNKYPDHEKAYSNYYRNGWLIFSSLDKPANAIVRYYKKRMQIEQNFRDIKNEKYGIGLRRNASKGIVRISMLFFLSTLITMILWWIGLMTEHAKEHYKYQANTEKRKRIRSLVHLGALVARHEENKLRWRSLHQIVNTLRAQYDLFISRGSLS